ncbi:hypothetical protein [Bradyrhizobium sp. Leo121]|uniref:hypothetical protein n=1 Tax=Bradyrhizobium sp. Leo121 TaxID=1571195 RepID=UPI00102A0796|nr:hypothetical protein [Bradyrhizobium sp. Leo121]RZN18272.1 hypothetical protein CWO90_36460 [Bradyrhizobium sp. Leo121]
MSYRICGALIASVGAAALLFAANDASARSGGAARAGVASAPSVVRGHVGPAFRPHRRGFVGGFWPGTAGYFDAPAVGEGIAGMPQSQSVSGDFRNTYTYDVPWDWAHRYPPMVEPSDRPYVSSCPSESVTVPGRRGGEHTVNITRCY